MNVKILLFFAFITAEYTSFAMLRTSAKVRQTVALVLKRGSFSVTPYPHMTGNPVTVTPYPHTTGTPLNMNIDSDDEEEMEKSAWRSNLNKRKMFKKKPVCLCNWPEKGKVGDSLREYVIKDATRLKSLEAAIRETDLDAIEEHITQAAGTGDFIVLCESCLPKVGQITSELRAYIEKQQERDNRIAIGVLSLTTAVGAVIYLINSLPL